MVAYNPFVETINQKEYQECVKNRNDRNAEQIERSIFMIKKLKLPVGIENFEEIRTQGFYYVDKTNLIRDLLLDWGKVNLFTRPSRFGKSLNMNMLKTFFEIGGDKSVFDGLNIAQEKELCQQYMGKFPVLAFSLKDVGGYTYDAAFDAMRFVVGNEASRFSFLAESDKLDKREREKYQDIIKIGKDGESIYGMSEKILSKSLLTLTQLLQKHYDRKVIILIDEYDVPLDKAFEAGYYEEMVALLRGMFSSALKTNDNLYFAVLTGCLRIAKESIFTGLNNFKVFTVTDVRFSQYFGLTDEEVRQMLKCYGLTEHSGKIKEWYDGYRFGNTEVYCPWDVINYCDLLLADPKSEAEDYWSNTSSNSIVRRFIEKATQQTRNEIEKLMNGEKIIKTVHQELTYSELDNSIDNLWSILFMTGYLTQRGRGSGKQYWLSIPNCEIKELFNTQIHEWFHDTAVKDTIKLDAFCEALLRENVEEVEELFAAYLRKTISIRDTGVRKAKKENFYHGILLGLLSYWENWEVYSNIETGDGYSDILVEVEQEKIGIIIEVKYGENGALEAVCEEALRQIEKNDYEQILRDNGMRIIRKYGIACYKKRCRVVTV